MNNSGAFKTDAILKLSLFFFVSLFAFTIGTYVGKRMTENERRRLAYDKEYEQLRQNAGMDANGEEQISDADIEKLSDEFVKAEANKMGNEESSQPVAAKEEPKAEEKQAMEDGFVKMDRKTASSTPKKVAAKPMEKKAEPTPEKTEAKTNMAAAKDVVKKAADRVAENKSPLPTPVPKREIARVLPKISPNSVGKYTVQVASYATEKEAKDHAKNLKDQGYSAFYISAKVKSRVWFRVSVGLFDSKTTANNFKRELVKQANLKSAIIQKIIK